MTQRSRFFDSTAGDRVYTSDAWAQVAAALMGNGVVAGFANQLVVSESSPAAMSIRVNTGIAFVLGYYFEVYSAQETLTIDTADATNPRIDLIVVRRDLANRQCILAVVKGTAASSPTAPALTQNTAGNYEIPLAQVRVEALATSIVNAKITDERGSRAISYDLTAALNSSTGHAHAGGAGDGVPIAWSVIASKPSTFAPTAHDHSSGGGNIVAWGSVGSKPSAFAPTDHGHTATGDGGSVNFSAIAAKPATYPPDNHSLDPAAGTHTGSLPWSNVSSKPSTFTPTDHTHVGAGTGGVISWTNIGSKPSTFAPSAHAASHANGAGDEVSIDWSQITSGKPSTFAPSAHASSHNNGGSDEVALDWSQITTGKPEFAYHSDSTSGDVGQTIWVQTTDPAGSSVDGDVWIKA